MAFVLLPLLTAADHLPRDESANTDRIVRVCARNKALEKHFGFLPWGDAVAQARESAASGSILEIVLEAGGEPQKVKIWKGRRDYASPIWKLRPVDGDINEIQDTAFTDEQVYAWFEEQLFHEGTELYDSFKEAWDRTDRWQSALEMERGSEVFYLRCSLTPEQVQDHIERALDPGYAPSKKLSAAD